MDVILQDWLSLKIHEEEAAAVRVVILFIFPVVLGKLSFFVSGMGLHASETQ